MKQQVIWKTHLKFLAVSNSNKLEAPKQKVKLHSKQNPTHRQNKLSYKNKIK